jgi:hypothetical protein
VGGYKFDESIPTGIHTRINDKLRISSAWRTFANEHFHTSAWETFLWDGDRIKDDSFPTLRDADSVVDLHYKIVDKYRSKIK